MKNRIGTLGLATLLGIATIGCSKEDDSKSYIISGENFDAKLGTVLCYNRHLTQEIGVEGVDTFYENHRGYPASGKLSALPLPRAKIKESSSKLKVQIYLPAEVYHSRR